MRFLPINLDNVSNAATLYVKFQNAPPQSRQWTYSSAYARLSAEIKTVGFDGYIVFGEDGYPVGFIMGHSEVREDGKSNFILRELCFEKNDAGQEAAKGALTHLGKILEGRCIDTLLIFTEKTPQMEQFLTSLGFMHYSDVMCLQKTSD